MRRGLVLVALLALLVGSSVSAQAGSSARGQEGGVLRVSFTPAAGLDSVDPALSFSRAGWALLDATCARLYTYPDTWSPASYRLQPEVAAGYSVSADWKTWTFTLRPGFRFSNGEPVRASAFHRAINRVLRTQNSRGATFMRDIAGADDVRSRRTKTARGVVARGNTLVVRFWRPAPDFLARTALPFFCAVPPWLRPSAEGLSVIPSAGPYYVDEHRVGERIVIRRNPYYGGKRKVHLEGFQVNLRGGTPVDLLRSIDRGDADWGYSPGGVFAIIPGLDFAAMYGINGPRFFVRDGLTLRMLAFNTSRPLFRNNPGLRRAVAFALDRRALVEANYGRVLSRATDQLLPPGVPGFRDASVYPLGGDLERAQELTRGRLRGAKPVLYVEDGFLPAVETAQLVKAQLARIGLEVEVRPQPGGAEYQSQLSKPGEPWDIAFVLWPWNIPDAHTHLSLLVDRWMQHVDSRVARGALARAARLPDGPGRNRAYADVDAMIVRDIAPVAVLGVLNEATIVSERVGCPVLRPALDLAAACLKE